MLAKNTERRKHERRSVRWPITVVSDQGNIPGETRNISFDGVYIRCDQPLRINENFRMAITPPDKNAIGITGRVVWSDFYGMEDDDTAVGMGVCLVQISARDRKSLHDAVSIHVKH
jgi:Tfp pilus assembly protein PilZ